MNTIKFAVAGLGRIGKIHLDNLLQMEGVEVVAAMDPSEECRLYAKNNNIPFITSSYKDLISMGDFSVILICSPTNTHADYVEMGALAGKDVFCEKPLDLSLERVLEVLKVVHESGVQLMLGFNRRFDKEFKKVHELVKEGAVGEPHLVKITSRDPGAPPVSYIKQSGGLFLDMTIHDFDMAIKLEPSIIETFVNRGNSLKFLGRLSEAAKSFDAALAIDKNNANAQFHYSILLLSQKRFSEGWEKYKYRWKAKNLKQPKFVEDLPSFSITERHGKLLVWCEQGIGDQIFFGSILRDLPKNLVVEVLINPKLIGLFKLSFPHISFISSESNIEISSYDFQIGLVELASLYRNSKDDLNKLPSRFIITNDAKNTAFKKIIQKNKKFTCGISWKSKNVINGYARSISLESLLPVLQTQGLSFVNLQYGDTTAETNYLKDNYDINFEDIGSVDNYNDLDSLASLIESCDFIITIDNSTVHLAGSMGKKTYLLLPYGLGSIWYWHDENQSIWYPSVEIFRQKESQDWCGVIEDILRKIQTRNTVN